MTSVTLIELVVAFQSQTIVLSNHAGASVTLHVVDAELFSAVVGWTRYLVIRIVCTHDESLFAVDFSLCVRWMYRFRLLCILHIISITHHNFLCCLFPQLLQFQFSTFIWRMTLVVLQW